MKKIILKLKFALTLARNDLYAGYAGSFLGVIWAFIYPCVTVLLYWFVFRVALRSSVGDGEPYILWLVSSLVPYLFLCDALPAAAGAFVDYSYLVKKVKFDFGVLPAARVISKFIIHLFFVFLLVIVAFALGYFPKTADLWLVYYITAEFVFILSVGTFLSVLTVFIRDIRSIIGVAVQIGYWLTPLFWDISGINSSLAGIIMIVNPVTYITEGFRNTILYGASPFDMPYYTIYFLFLIIIIGAAAYLLLKKSKGKFADYV